MLAIFLFVFCLLSFHLCPFCHFSAWLSLWHLFIAAFICCLLPIGKTPLIKRQGTRKCRKQKFVKSAIQQANNKLKQLFYAVSLPPLSAHLLTYCSFPISPFFIPLSSPSPFHFFLPHIFLSPQFLSFSNFTHPWCHSLHPYGSV